MQYVKVVGAAESLVSKWFHHLTHVMQLSQHQRGCSQPGSVS